MSEDNSTAHSKMEEGAITFQSNEAKAHVKYSRIKRRILKHVWLVRILIIASVLAVFFGLITLGINQSKKLGISNVSKIVSNFIFTPVDEVDSENGRTNILVMGIGGKGHAGADLTDTILLVSVSLNKPSVVIISIPRDLWIPEIRAKINSSYYWGGIPLAKSTAEEVTGTKVQYGMVIDFSAFKEIIDDIGGIQVTVDNSFTDKLYPVAGRENDTCGGDPKFACRYETITFEKGTQFMDGTTALKFVRSRYAEGPEGTDIAREARQQKVIDAIKNKVMTPRVFLNIKTDLKLFKDINSSLVRDIDDPTAAIIARKILAKGVTINRYLIPDNLLVNPPISVTYDKQYVFIPKAGSGNWQEINKWVQSVLN